MKLVNQRHPLRKTPLWQALPYTAMFENCLPAACVRWINGENQSREDNNDSVEEEAATPRLKVSDEQRKVLVAAFTGKFEKLDKSDIESLV